MLRISLRGLFFFRFDQRIGPSIIFKLPIDFDNTVISKLLSLMDLEEENIFIHSFENYKSINLIFNIESKYTRGNKETLQISLVIDRDSKIDESFLEKLLVKFIRSIKEITDLDNFFFSISTEHEKHFQIQEQLILLFQTFYQSTKTTIDILIEKEHEYQTLFENARDAIILFDINSFEIIDMNSYTETIFDLPKNKILEQKITELLKIKEHEIFKNKLLKLSSEEFSEFIELNFKNNRGREIFLEINANSIGEKKKNIIQIVIRDITKRTLLQIALNERLKELNALYKLSKLMDKKNYSIHQILDKCLIIIQNAMKFPHIARVRILFNKEVWISNDFKETEWKISTHIKIYNKLLDLEVFYIEEKEFLEEKLTFLFEFAHRLRLSILNKIGVL
ncbi:MAG: PAS domain S-box protein [Candidatus Lokiarchaeota archaeon]|nr:PAS domain S-box protein [Candidatus Lokiarchaeota archaeon]